MNPMIAALQKSRQDNPVSSSGPMPDSTYNTPAMGRGMGGEMAKYWKMMEDMNSKLDKLMAMFGGNAPENEVKEDANGKPGNGY